MEKIKMRPVEDFEKSIVQGMADGVPSRDIAKSLNIEERRIYHYINKLKLFYNCNTAMHLVAFFLRKKIIK